MHITSDGDQHRRFNRLVGMFHRDMYGYAIWLCRDKSITEDVVQEALLRAWCSLDNLWEDAAAKPWLMTIIRRDNGDQPRSGVDALAPGPQAAQGEDRPGCRSMTHQPQRPPARSQVTELAWVVLSKYRAA